MKFLYVMKRDYLKTQFQDHKGNSKYLYKLMAKLTGGVSVNSMPDSNSDVELANDFGNFFWNKIVKIRNELDEILECFFCLKTEILNELNKFQTLSEQQVIKMMGKLQTKSCEMDLIPTHILKIFPHVFSPVLTKFVNLSLSTGKFDDSWKVATLHPLIRYASGPTINQNYRPVSNLSFISKLTEKCVQDQYIDHCDKALLNSTYQSA